MDINAAYLWIVTAVTFVVAVNTVWKVWAERARLFTDELTDADRALAWRVVFFLGFPLITLLDLRSTVVACNLAGGFVKSWHYGFLWYQVTPAAVPEHLLIPVLLAGPIASTIWALLLIPPLFFRPHPFLACVLGYASAFILALNLIVQPILALIGLEGKQWEQIAATCGQQLLWIALAYTIAAFVFLILIRNARLRLWFSELTRPVASQNLREALSSLHGRPDNAQLSCRIGLLYDKAGLRRQASAQLKAAKQKYPNSIYTLFLDSLIAYRRRDYQTARHLFIITSDVHGVDGELKASLLAAAACAAFASDDVIGALNLCERALEFDYNCLISRMVKVDVFLRQGKREQAGEEILYAMRLGLALELENKVPLDIEHAFKAISSLAEREPVERMLQTSSTAQAR